MASTLFATPPSSPRKASFSSLKLSPIKSLNFIKRKSSVDVADLALGGELAKRGSSASSGGDGEGVVSEGKKEGEANEKTGSLRIKKKQNGGTEGASSLIAE